MEITLASWMNTKRGLTYYAIKKGVGFLKCLLLIKGEGEWKVALKKI